MEERWISVEQVATHLGISRDTVYKWISRKQMPAHKVGKLWKFRLTEIDEWVTSGHAKDREGLAAKVGQESKDGDA